MRLKQYLYEMSVTQALAVFGLDATIDPEELKKRHRELAMRHHPDKGGSLEMMKSVNAAYDVLKHQKAAIKTNRFDWDALHAQYRQMGAAIKMQILSKFQPDIFCKYFESVTGKEFDWSFRRVFPADTTKDPSYAGFEGDWRSQDGETIFSIHVSAYLVDMFRNTNIGHGDIDFTLTTEVFGFHDNRKVKMGKRDFNWTQDHDILKNPKKLFPEAKMKVILFGYGVKKAFKKRDMELFLIKKMNATFSGDYAYIPLSNTQNIKLTIYRNVFMRVPGWGINGIYVQHHRLTTGPYFTLSEDEEAAKFLESVQKKALQWSSEDDIVRVVTEMLKEKQRNIALGRE